MSVDLAVVRELSERRPQCALNAGVPEQHRRWVQGSIVAVAEVDLLWSRRKRRLIKNLVTTVMDLD